MNHFAGKNSMKWNGSCAFLKHDIRIKMSHMYENKEFPSLKALMKFVIELYPDLPRISTKTFRWVAFTCISYCSLKFVVTLILFNLFSLIIHMNYIWSALQLFFKGPALPCHVSNIDCIDIVNSNMFHVCLLLCITEAWCNFTQHCSVWRVPRYTKSNLSSLNSYSIDDGTPLLISLYYFTISIEQITVYSLHYTCMTELSFNLIP